MTYTTAHLARARHMRSSEDMDAIIAAARIRLERRQVAYLALADWPTPAMWRALDRYHEAQHLVDSLEDRRAELEDHAAESQWLDRVAEGYLA